MKRSNQSLLGLFMQMATILLLNEKHKSLVGRIMEFRVAKDTIGFERVYVIEAVAAGHLVPIARTPDLSRCSLPFSLALSALYSLGLGSYFGTGMSTCGAVRCGAVRGSSSVRMREVVSPVCCASSSY